ncbi:MAG: hypothetical protein GY861_01640 [bacterium]|nr:hypothetical protein [bacterium]
MAMRRAGFLLSVILILVAMHINVKAAFAAIIAMLLANSLENYDKCQNGVQNVEK